MARMIPEYGPHETESFGEQQLYSIFKNKLPDDYIVIHSLPWLCAAVKTLDPHTKPKPTGEIDFLIIHPENGVLALEVKSGVYRVEESVFVHVKNNFVINPINQTRKNIHGLSSWLGTNPSLRLRIGYGFIFPDSDFRSVPVSPGMFDTTTNPPQPLYIDFMNMPEVEQHIIRLMVYWKRALSNPSLGAVKTAKLIEFLTPTIDGQPQWGRRIVYDNKIWLRLTNEQSNVVRSVLRNKISLINGWPGTGKTLVAIEAARKLTFEKKRVLFISFNKNLTEYVKEQLSEYPTSTVCTWHSLCRQAEKELGRINFTDEWYKTICAEDLLEAVNNNLMTEYDALIVDEAQALSPSWCQLLIRWFKEKQTAFFCDETQIFPYEQDTVSLIELSEMLGVEPFFLTIILRMPKAITETISEVIHPKLQHYSPRDFKEDTLQEIITITPCEDLVKAKMALIASGVCESDIVILTGSIVNSLYFSFLLKEKETSETIAKFRGLESPVVLIIGAEQLSTSELFCAYSRATSMCIVFYNANNRYWDDKQGFQIRLQNKPKSLAKLKSERSKLLIRNLIDCNSATEPENLKSLTISWAIDWNAWLIEINNDATSVQLWLEYLSRNWMCPIFFWYKDTSSQFYQVRLVDEEKESVLHTPVVMSRCEICSCHTPHRYININMLCCSLCSDGSKKLDKDNVSYVRLLDQIITKQLPQQDILSLRSSIPIHIAAVAAILYARRNYQRTRVLDVPLPKGRHMYITAFAFAQARIAIHKSNEVMLVKDLADEIYERFSSLRKILSKFDWRQTFANAMGTFFFKGYLNKVEKGFYKAVEDDFAPIAKKDNQKND